MDDSDKTYTKRENLWDQQWPETSQGVSDHPEEELDSVDEMTPYPETSGTSDVIEAIRDAEPYVPPVDPPVLPGGAQGIHMSSGFDSSLDEAGEGALPRGDEHLHDLALGALHRDSLTSKFILDVNVRNGVIRLRGFVQSIDDSEHATWLLGELPGVVDVVDETTLEQTAGQ